MKLNLECSAADLYLIAQAFRQAEELASRNRFTAKYGGRVYQRVGRSNGRGLSAEMRSKRADTYEYQKELFAGLHDMFLDAIPEETFKVTVEHDE